MQSLPWIVAIVASTLFLASLGAWAWRLREQRHEALPTEWELAARPVFSADERRVYRTLREALPHHVLLSKLPLVRFCQPTDPSTTRYWYELLGNSYVSFAVCSANGRVLAAIDLDSDRNSTRRVSQIKQAALGACRVRYLRCAVDHLPSVAELQLLVPNSGGVAPSAQPTWPLPRPGTRGAAPHPSDAMPRRAPRPPLWQDTTVFQDSFFTVDENFDEPAPEAFAPHAVRPRVANEHQRSLSARLFGAPGARRRNTPPADFEPTRDALEEDDDDFGELSGSTSHYDPGR